jgi:hypothetical protein
MFLVYSTHLRGSCYQIIKQKGDYNGSKEGIDGQEQALALDANRGVFIELWLYLSSFVH